MKKNLLVIIFLMCNVCLGQFHPTGCDEYLNYTYDKMTGITYISTKDVYVKSNETSINLSFIIFGKNILLKFDTKALNNCIPQNNKVYILFSDQSRMEIQSTTIKNCEGSTLCVFGESLNNLNQMTIFKSKQIESIRIVTETGFIQHDIPFLESEKLVKSIQCLMLIPR